VRWRPPAEHRPVRASVRDDLIQRVIDGASSCVDSLRSIRPRCSVAVWNSATTLGRFVDPRHDEPHCYTDKLDLRHGRGEVVDRLPACSSQCRIVAVTLGDVIATDDSEAGPQRRRRAASMDPTATSAPSATYRIARLDVAWGAYLSIAFNRPYRPQVRKRQRPDRCCARSGPRWR
jgi:hypothetical protein